MEEKELYKLALGWERKLFKAHAKWREVETRYEQNYESATHGEMPQEDYEKSRKEYFEVKPKYEAFRELYEEFHRQNPSLNIAGVRAYVIKEEQAEGTSNALPPEIEGQEPLGPQSSKPENPQETLSPLVGKDSDRPSWLSTFLAMFLSSLGLAIVSILPLGFIVFAASLGVSAALLFMPAFAVVLLAVVSYLIAALLTSLLLALGVKFLLPALTSQKWFVQYKRSFLVWFIYFFALAPLQVLLFKSPLILTLLGILLFAASVFLHRASAVKGLSGKSSYSLAPAFFAAGGIFAVGLVLALVFNPLADLSKSIEGVKKDGNFVIGSSKPDKAADIPKTAPTGATVFKDAPSVGFGADGRDDLDIQSVALASQGKYLTIVIETKKPLAPAGSFQFAAAPLAKGGAVSKDGGVDLGPSGSEFEASLYKDKDGRLFHGSGPFFSISDADDSEALDPKLIQVKGNKVTWRLPVDQKEQMGLKAPFSWSLATYAYTYTSDGTSGTGYDSVPNDLFSFLPYKPAPAKAK